MNPRERYARAQELFLLAREVRGDRRSTLLDEACGDDTELRQEVGRLLEHDEKPLPLIDAPFGGDGSAHPLRPVLEAFHAGGDHVPPRSVGQFRILRKLGEGGMGAVYEAVQERPNRTVALKLLHASSLSPDTLLRFEREGEFLGRLQHPGIAQIFESGTAETEYGPQPWFAMEFVRGEPLTAYARSHSLSVPERLELVARVADAVQHAHQQSVIHRDLKPENILIDDAGNPKILDFGIARASDSDVRLATLRTDVGQILGTLAYMSPEQASGDPDAIDTRSDVYSLGVLLYELLSGRLPYEVSRKSLLEAVRAIQEEEPRPLSALHGSHRGDVETIVATAIQKDRERRYGSAAALAMDLRRFLRHEPITARPPSRLYTLGKFVRRNKAVVVATLAVFLALVSGLVLTARYGMREAAQRRAYARDSYRVNLPATAHALREGNLEAVEHVHRATPEDLRNWEWRHLDQKWLREAARLELPGLFTAAFLDETSILAVDDAGAVHVWNALTGETTDVSSPADGGADWPAGERVLALTSDARRLLTHRAGELSLGDPLGGEPPIVFPCGDFDPKGLPGSSAVSPEGSRVAVASASDEVLLFEVGQEPRQVPIAEPGPEVRSVEFDPSGRLLHIQGGVWDAEALVLRWDYPGAEVTFTPDGAQYAVESNNQAGTGAGLYFKDVSTGLTQRQLTRLQFGVRHSEPCSDASFDRREELLALSFTNGDIRLMDAKAGSPWPLPPRIQTPIGALIGVAAHENGGTVRVGFSPSGQGLLSIGLDDETLRVWPTDGAGRVCEGSRSYIYALAIAPDGATLASGTWDGEVRLWDAVSGEPLATLPVGGKLHGLAFAPNGRHLACRKWGSIVIWDHVLAREVARIAVRSVTTGIAYSPDGTLLAADAGGVVRVWDARSHEVLHELEIEEGHGVFGLAFSADGRMLATGSSGSQLCLWSVASGERLARYVNPRPRARVAFSGLRSLAFAPDGTRLVAAWGNAAVTLHDIPSLVETHVMLDHRREVFTVAFSPDGTRIASGGHDGRLRIWDAETGDLLAPFDGHDQEAAYHYIKALVFSPDGSRIATGSGDTTVRIWDSAPADERWRARREAERLRPRAEHLVAELYDELGEASAVVARLEGDGGLDPELRRLALREVLRRESR